MGYANFGMKFTRTLMDGRSQTADRIKRLVCLNTQIYKGRRSLHKQTSRTFHLRKIRDDLI